MAVEKKRWWVQSDEGDGQTIKAPTALEAVKKWAASEWADIEDGQTIEALDVALVQKFVARQTNEIADEDLDTLPKFEFVPDPSSGGPLASTESERVSALNKDCPQPPESVSGQEGDE